MWFVCDLVPYRQLFRWRFLEFRGKQNDAVGLIRTKSSTKVTENGYIVYFVYENRKLTALKAKPESAPVYKMPSQFAFQNDT